ncbi:MAG: hypothetical protein HN929_11565 [Chloroflexi bacterium]|jgi:hypothetical protein|nr:hypothetical protein [Chloroflexota bacterium]
MPKYRYEGKAPTRIGIGAVEYGMVVELPTAPNRLFVEIKEVVAPVIKPVKTLPKITKEDQ